MSSARPFFTPNDATPLGKEYRRISDSLARCTRHVTTFDGAPYEPAAVERARKLWLVRLASEYHSTVVFSAMVPQLMEARASIEATAVVLRMAQDELRHAEACAHAVRALGGIPELAPVVPYPPLAHHEGCSAEERALRNVIYGCALSEVVNTARLVDSLDTMRDPFLKDVTRALLSDEVLHGQFGFLYLEEWREWLVAHGEVRASIATYLRHAFVMLERELSGVGAPLKTLTEDERALGLPNPARLPESFYATVEEAIVPGLEEFGIEADRAWRERKLSL